jgi:hypothetical protein
VIALAAIVVADIVFIIPSFIHGRTVNKRDHGAPESMGLECRTIGLWQLGRGYVEQRLIPLDRSISVNWLECRVVVAHHTCGFHGRQNISFLVAQALGSGSFCIRELGCLSSIFLRYSLRVEK